MKPPVFEYERPPNVRAALEALSKHGVPATVVRNLEEVIDDEQTAARNMTPVVDHPVAGSIRVLGVPVQLSETPGRIAGAAPLLGADTENILKNLCGRR